MNQPILTRSKELPVAGTTFQIVLTGIQPTVPSSKARAGLATLFKATPEQIDRLLASPGYVVKKNCSPEVVTKYKIAIETAGGTCQLVPEERDDQITAYEPQSVIQASECCSDDDEKEPPQSDIDDVWEQIYTMEPPEPVKEIESKYYRQSPIPLPASAARSKKMARFQKGAAVVFGLLAGWNMTMTTEFVVVLVFFAIWFQFPLARGPIIREKKLRQSRHAQAANRYQALKTEWNKRGSDDLFQNKFLKLEKLRSEFDHLPKRLYEELIEFTAELKDEQFREHMENASIDDAAIEGIGRVLIEKLQSYGIYSAIDVRRDAIRNIHGFGQVREDSLMAWRNEIEEAFAFDPREFIDPDDYESMLRPIVNRAEAIERLLIDGLEDLNTCRAEILNYRKNAISPLCEAAKELQQGGADILVC